MAWIYLVTAGIFEWGWPIGLKLVWTGIGAVGTFFIGILVFSEAATLARFFFVGLIIVGIPGLKLSSIH